MENNLLNPEDSSRLLYAQLSFTNSFAFQLKPKLYREGNKWCALYGENIQEGICGFGDSPIEAFGDFDKNFLTEVSK